MQDLETIGSKMEEYGIHLSIETMGLFQFLKLPTGFVYLRKINCTQCEYVRKPGMSPKLYIVGSL